LSNGHEGCGANAIACQLGKQGLLEAALFRLICVGTRLAVVRCMKPPKPSTWLTLTLITCVAYFQASAITRLIAERWLDVPRAAPRTAMAGMLLPAPLGAERIIARNPFDSITGPLLGRSLGKLEPSSVPECEDAQLLVVSEADDRGQSLASLRVAEDAPALLRRAGDALGRQRVELIGYDPERRTPAVWLSEGETLCRASLFRAEHSSLSASGAAKASTAVPIRKLSDSEYELDRSTFEDILARQASLLASTRIVPELRDGKVAGIRLFGVRPGGVLSSLGVQNGDRLDSVNGYALGEPEQALQAFAALRRSTSFDVRLERRGKPLAIAIRIR
jgi:general secretion pathway protein C